MAGGSRRDRSRSPRGDRSKRRDSNQPDKTSGNSSMSVMRREAFVPDNSMSIQPGMTTGNPSSMTMGNQSSVAMGNQPGMNMGNQASMNMTNPMMMPNMFTQGMPGNMMLGGMYNMMMGQNNMMGGHMMPSNSLDMMSSNNMDMIHSNNMDMMSSSGMTNMDVVPQTGMDMSNMTGQGLASTQNTTMDMNMMGGLLPTPTMMGNPAMMGMYSNMGAGDVAMPQEKKEIIFKYCTLSPPAPGTPQPPCRPKPPGCRTIFVGGLPDKIKESIVRDIFESYGRIQTLRLSKKNFCHIRFDKEESVDAAMMITGYHIKLVGKDEKDTDAEENPRAYTGWLHVDYAMSRDDQNDFERRQRDVLRMQQAQMGQMGMQHHRGMSNYRRSPSPLRVIPFSSAAITQLAEKIKTEDMFHASIPTLISWLERGECSKKNANQFYSMIQATNSHIRRLFNEKMQAEDELQEFKDKIRIKIETVIDQLEQVGKVFAAATHQRVWDHFTKPQRKNIETWQRMTQEFSTLREEFQEKFNNEDSDYNNGINNKPLETGPAQEEVLQLKRENESLQFQLEAYKNEVDVIKRDTQKEMEKFKAQFIARQALQNNIQSTPALPPPPPPPMMSRPPPPPPLPEDLDAMVHLKEAVEQGAGEAKLISVVATFLHVHPQGASLDYIVSYVRAMFPHISQATIHHVLQKHNEVFERKQSGIGANIESKWHFVAFKMDGATKLES